MLTNQQFKNEFFKDIKMFGNIEIDEIIISMCYSHYKLGYFHKTLEVKY